MPLSEETVPSLLHRYSKELNAELTKIPVVLPGEPVKIGDVLVFREGRSGFFSQRASPVGSFAKVTELKALGVPLEADSTPEDMHTYVYASRRSTSIHMDGSAKGNGGVPGTASADGTLVVNFKDEGALYLAAVDCRRHQAKDLLPLADAADYLSQRLSWQELFIVIGVTIAKRALIMQSATNSASLTVAGDVKGLAPGAGSLLNASASVSVQSMHDASFIKPWSENVTVFFDLVQLRPGSSGLATTVQVQSAGDAGDDHVVAPDLIPFALPQSGGWRVEPVSPFNLLQE